MKYPWLVAVDTRDQVAGYVYASSHRDPPSYKWSVNTSVYIRADGRGQGVGKQLYTEMFEQLVSLGHYRAYAGIALPNETCVALHESVGFEPIGVYKDVGYKFGAWCDVSWWQKQIQEPAIDPPPPRPFES